MKSFLLLILTVIYLNPTQLYADTQFIPFTESFPYPTDNPDLLATRLTRWENDNPQKVFLSASIAASSTGSKNATMYYHGIFVTYRNKPMGSNKISPLHSPTIILLKGHTRWVYCEPKPNVADPSIVYYDISKEIVSVSASHPTASNTVYCVTFRDVKDKEAVETFVLNPNNSLIDGVRWVALTTESMNELVREIEIRTADR